MTRTSIPTNSPMHPIIYVLGYSEAAMLLRQGTEPPIEAIIAIAGQREHFLDTSAIPHVLKLSFDDMEAFNENDPLHEARMAQRQRQAASVGLILTPPTMDDVREIIEFAESIRDIRGSLLCHCLGGISRSSAAALICLSVWMGEGREADCVDTLRRTRPAAQPNRDMIRMADILLVRGNRLVQSVRATFGE